MLAAVKGGYELVTNGVEFEGAYRAKDKDLLRALAPGSGAEGPVGAAEPPDEGS